MVEEMNLDNIEVKNDEYKKYLKDDGEYVVTVESFEQGVSANKGTPFIKFECKTDNNEYVNVSLYLTEQAGWRFKKFIMALGHPGTGVIKPLSVAQMCIGKKCKVICAHKETLDPVTNEKTVGKYLEVVDFVQC